MLKRVTIIGHPLAAEENRLAFLGWESMHVDLILPKFWKARSLGTDYRFAKISTELNTSENQLRFYPLPVLAGGRNSFFVWVGLSKLLKQLGPDLIYCWEEPWCLATFQVGLVAHKLGIPLLFYSAENRPKRLPWPFSAVQKVNFLKYRAGIVPTQEIAMQLKASGFAKPIFEIPLWIRSRSLLNTKVTDSVLVYVGRLIPLKRVHLLIECLQLLPQFRLRIIGDGPERANLKALVLKYGLEKRVEFLGHLDNAHLEGGLEGSSLLVLPTAENPRQAEQFGKAALEGVSCGLPVLTSRTGNLAVLAKTIKTLIAQDLDSAEQMAMAVSNIWKDFPSSSSLQTSKEQVEREYGSFSAGQKFQRSFLTLLSGTESP